MKYITLLLVLLFTISFQQACKSPASALLPVVYDDPNLVKTGIPITISLENGSGFNHPSYVIWQEDMMGNYVKTLFITKSYASGIFGHQMVGDSIWLKTSGESHQPAALPFWSHKKGLLKNNSLIPSPESPFADAYTGATPTNDLLFNTKLSGAKPMRIWMEVNQAWDWNEYWVNNKYPESEAYKHSAQPSLIYAVTIDDQSDVFYLNPVGHGDPTGETGKLFTNLNTMTTSKKIFDSIKITLKNL